ncbi:MFS transporter [Embleya sp. NBC_00888]|uniref:MFS transporter n=1 Tax=Embleya sp. NBC_00888 TaxID=2975960 RepID=UPI00386FFE3D|nr:MFS transporter [Embleya sp. NBC_00888]
MNANTSPPPVPTPAPVPPAAAAAAPHPRRWAALAVVLLAETMDLLDSTVVGVAAPSVQADLGGGSTGLQWIAAAYTLTFAVGLITGGRLGDILGRRRTFLIGLGGFTVSSALCAAAPSIELLIAARAVQGLFAALTIPQTYSVVVSVFAPAERGKAFGLFGPVMALASVGGPIVAGGLIEADLAGTGWRAIFLINVPLGVLAILGALRYVPESRAQRRPGLDPIGMVLVSAAVLLLVHPLVQGRESHWPAWTFVSMGAALPVLVGFAWWQRRVARSGGSPLVVPSLLAKRAFTGSLLVGLVFFAAMNGLILVFGLFLQIGLGWSAVHAGLASTPIALGVVLGAVGAGAVLVPRFGRTVLHAGAIVMAAGAGALSLTLRRLGPDVDTWHLTPALLVVGIGTGLVLAPFFDIALASVEDHETGSASGVLNANQQLGATLGVAILGTLFFDLAADPDAVRRAGAYTHALERTLWAVVAALLLVALTAFLLPRRPREDDAGDPDDADDKGRRHAEPADAPVSGRAPAVATVAESAGAPIATGSNPTRAPLSTVAEPTGGDR